MIFEQFMKNLPPGSVIKQVRMGPVNLSTTLYIDYVNRGKSYTLTYCIEGTNSLSVTKNFIEMLKEKQITFSM